MHALKSILGSPLIDETTALGCRKVALTDVVELFIRPTHSRQAGTVLAYTANRKRLFWLAVARSAC
jgi:hypothetical protein